MGFDSTRPRSIPTPGMVADQAGTRRRPLRHSLSASGGRAAAFHRAAVAFAAAHGLLQSQAARAYAQHLEERRAVELHERHGLPLLAAQAAAAREAREGKFNPDRYQPPATTTQ